MRGVRAVNIQDLAARYWMRGNNRVRSRHGHVRVVRMTAVKGYLTLISEVKILFRAVLGGKRLEVLEE